MYTYFCQKYWPQIQNNNNFLKSIVLIFYGIVVVQSLSRVQLFATPWTVASQLPCPSLSPWVCSKSCPSGSDGKESACNAGDPGLIPESGRYLEKGLATHSSILAWRIPLTEEPGWLQSMGSKRVRCNQAINTHTCPLSQWCHPTISSSVAPFSSCSQSFPASGSFPMSGLFASDGQSIGAPALASVLPINTQGWFPLGLTGLISLLFKGLLSLL